MEEKNVTIKSIATNYGTYLGGLLAILTVLVYAVNLDLMTNMWYGIFILLAIVVLLIALLNPHLCALITPRYFTHFDPSHRHFSDSNPASLSNPQHRTHKQRDMNSNKTIKTRYDHHRHYH